jgi:predicted O-linked N-acetylglucosamine transferase (SPINDLY family)
MNMLAQEAASFVTQGQELLRLRRDVEALECFERARASSPSTAALVIGECQALLRLGRHADAREVLDNALLDQPTLRGTHGVRAQVYLLKGDAEAAWAAATEGRGLDCEDSIALMVRGVLLLEKGNAAEALAEFDQAIAQDPALASAHQGRGGALAALGRPQEAMQSFGMAAGLDPNNAVIPVRIGHLLIHLNHFAAAAEAFAAALALDPRQIDALQGHAQCLAALDRSLEATEAYARLLAVAPDTPYMRGEHFHLLMHCCDWREFEHQSQDLAIRVRRGERVDNPGSFLTHCDSPADQRRCAEIFASDFCEPPTGVAAAGRGAGGGVEPAPRIRLAYLSADFYEHATAFLAAGLFEAHDKSKFETFGISFGPDDGSVMRQRLVRAFDHFEDVRHLSDGQIAELLEARGIDIAVDLKGYTLGARPHIMALRPAPVQVSYLGYPGTLGAHFMDYIVADRTVIPEDSQRHYAERVIYMPDCYQVNDSSRRAGAVPPRRAAGLPESAFVFCCFNSHYKITPPVFDEWMQVLRAVPHGILWLLAGNDTAEENLRREALWHGVEAERIVFAPRQSAAQHLARCALADVFLDTRPYNAHTTASDALWSGVPIITRPGDGFASRVATSLLRAVRLPQLSVGSSREYIDLAIRLAQSPAELESLKRVLARARDESALFDTARFCRHLESAFTEIVARSRRGEPPSPLVLEEL